MSLNYMKKLINGTQVKINTDFFSDYIYGRMLNKITLSNIYEDPKFDKDISSTINKYREVYDDLHPVMQTVESNPKYCLMGELMGLPYKVAERTLFVKTKGAYLCFKGENWSIQTNIPSKTIVWKDCNIASARSYRIYKDYLTFGKEEFMRNAFTDLWSACDESEAKFEKELDTLLLFMETSPTSLNDNEIIDPILGIKYKIISSYSGSSANSKKKQMTINVSKGSANTEDELKDNYKFTVYKQEMVEGKSGKRDYGKEEKQDGIFQDIFFILNQNNENHTKGLKLGDTIYYEVGEDIWKSTNGASELVVQKGQIYGNKMNNLLLVHDVKLDQGIRKRMIYIMKDNSLDIASITFSREEEKSE